MPLHPPNPPQNPYRVFFAVTGVSLFALLSGFSACLFDVSQIGACVDHAEYAVDILKKFGDHVIGWFIALVREVLGRHPLPFR